MSSSFVVESQDSECKKDDTLIIVVNDDGTISVDQQTLQNLISEFIFLLFCCSCVCSLVCLRNKLFCRIYVTSKRTQYIICNFIARGNDVIDFRIMYTCSLIFSQNPFSTKC